MLTKGLRYLTGYCAVRVSRRLCAFAARRGLRILSMRDTADGMTELILSRTACRELDAIARENGFERPTVLWRRGFPVLLSRLIRRPGLIAGTGLFVLTIVVSSLFIWDVRLVSGNLSKTQTEELLARYGVGVGMRIKGFDPNDKEVEIRVGEPTLSRLSINRYGTVLYVEAKQSPTEIEDVYRGKITKLTATADGMIEYFSLQNGRMLVEPGQMVQKGDLLAVGVEGGTNTHAAYRFVRASGEVMAEILHPISFDFPLIRSFRSYSGEVFAQYRVNFFKKQIKLFSNSSILNMKCAIIEDGKLCTFANGATLPVSVSRVRYVPYTEKMRRLGEDEARRGAAEMLQKRIEEELPGAQIEERDVRVTPDKDVLHVYCAVRCIYNVAEESEMTEEEIREFIETNDRKNSSD